MQHSPHGHAARSGVRVALLTVSDTRSSAADASGQTARRLIIGAGHAVVDQRIEPDEPTRIRAAVEAWVDRADCDAVIITGGTGIAPRDRTHEAIAGLLELRLDGFGELFRALSFAEVGSRAMLSRALGGICRGKPVFALPGAPRAVELGLVRLILPELGHLLGELSR
jgi:molybdenum cofactor biosynthesis protein B